jgi:outer membrane receptor protein involved in Fe transport
MTARQLLLVAPLLVGSVAPLAPTSASLFSPRALGAQSPTAAPAAGRGRITGRVVDAKTGAALSDVGVQVAGTATGTLSGVDGRFTLAAVSAGTITLTVRRLGYQPKSITGVVVQAGRTVEQDVALTTATVQLQAIAVTASAERGSVNAALDAQRTATGIVNAVTREQIARSPDADAAAAVSRVSGVTVQDGKYVFVRGLGERYTTASLNGARIPSPEPERKVVPLDLFPAGLLQTVTTSKTFTPDQQGDFSGAQVDITTREFPAQRQWTLALSSGVNTAATGREVLRAPLAARSEWVGTAGNPRALPGGIAALGNFGTLAPQPGVNTLARTFRNTWSPSLDRGLPNAGASLSAGGQAPVLGQRIGYIGSASYGVSQEVRSDERVAATLGQDGRLGEVNRFSGSTGRQSMQVGGLLNLSTLVGRSRLSLNNTYSRTADSEARRDSGVYEALAAPIQRTTLRYVERTIRSNQLRAEHAFGPRQQLDLSFTNSGVSRREPDRSDLAYVRDQDPTTGELRPYALLEQSLGSARRTFADLRESGNTADLRYRIDLGTAARPIQVRTGAFWRGTDRDAVNGQFNLQLRPGMLSAAERQQSAEAIFGGRALENGASAFNLQQLSAGGSYDARDRVNAGFLMAEVPFGERYRLVGGARVEDADIRVRTQQTAGSDTTARLRNTDVLPSLALNVSLRENQNLRLSASRTLARPEYRELSPVSFFEVLGGGVVTGNAGLRRSLIQNYDVRWEWYPSAGEILSLAAFGKRFTDPIERVDQATSGEPQVTFVNAERATNYGVELEARKGLGFLGGAFEPLTAFANVTVMRSDITVGNRGISGNTNNNRPMVGQSPYVVNSGLTYGRGQASATLLFNRTGQRIVSAGIAPLADNYEQPRNVVDLSLRYPVVSGLAVRLDARNLLDAPFRVLQGPVTREYYRLGRVIGVGFTYQPANGFTPSAVPGGARR